MVLVEIRSSITTERSTAIIFLVDFFVKLAKIAAKAKPSTPVAYSFNGENFSYDEVQETLRAQVAELAPDYRGYREHKNTIFRIIEETLSEIVPERIKSNYDQFAEVKHYAQGDKPIFRRKTNARNRNRGKQFVTRVGLAGVYEVWKLGQAQESFEVPTNAIGGAAQIGFEEFLDGRADWVELINILYKGIDDLIFEEIGAAPMTPPKKKHWWSIYGCRGVYSSTSLTIDIAPEKRQ